MSEGEKGYGKEYCMCLVEKKGGVEYLKRVKERKQRHRREILIVNSTTEIGINKCGSIRRRAGRNAEVIASERKRGRRIRRCEEKNQGSTERWGELVGKVCRSTGKMPLLPLATPESRSPD